MPRLDTTLESRLINFSDGLVDQERASIAVSPNHAASGFWFGGGNLIEDAQGDLYLVGRYRNFGDSRTGLYAGERGLELAVFSSTDRGQTFEKQFSWSKADLNVGDRCVLSIEGSSLHWTPHGVELFVSSEKDGIGYPDEFASHLKPNTGVWTIEQLQAASISELKGVPCQTVLASRDPLVVHMKDPVSYDTTSGDFVLMYCTHPFSWASSNTAYATRSAGEDEIGDSCLDFFPRGFAWDIAITRGTCILDVPQVGAFADQCISLLFYDGGESLRNLDEHNVGVKRPRGYSCEEISGVAYFVDGDMSQIYRLSRHEPLFISPYGTGCSRYVDVLSSADGYYATWQQSQDDLSQPLVLNFVAREDAVQLLV